MIPGFTWDLGGHVQFSHYGYYDDVLERALGDAWLWHERESWVWIRGRFVPYPFQLNLHHLDPPDRDAALAGLEQRRRRAATCRGISPSGSPRIRSGSRGELFMVPITARCGDIPRTVERRLDRGPCGAADLDGSGATSPSVVTMSRGARTTCSDSRSREARAPSGKPSRHASAEKLRFGHRVRRVRLSESVLILENGHTFRFDTLVSTVPLDILTTMVEGLSAQAVEAGRRFIHSSVHIIGVGLQGAQPETLAQEVLDVFPEASSPYYRVTVFSNYSPRNVRRSTTAGRSWPRSATHRIAPLIPSRCGAASSRRWSATA